MDEDLTDLRDVDFQIKGYTFSEPFHLIVSYGEVPERTDRCRAALFPISQSSLFSPTAYSGSYPQKIGHGRGCLLPHLQLKKPGCPLC